MYRRQRLDGREMSFGLAMAFLNDRKSATQPRVRLRVKQKTCSSCAIRTNHGTRQRVWSVCLRPSLHRATRSRLLRRALQTSRMQPFNGQTSRIQPFNGHAIVLPRGPCRGAQAIRVGGRSLRVELFIRPTHVISEVLCHKRSVGRHPWLHGTRWARVLRRRLSGASNFTS